MDKDLHDLLHDIINAIDDLEAVQFADTPWGKKAGSLWDQLAKIKERENEHIK